MFLTFAPMEMQLVLDFGNTSLKAALFKGSEIHTQKILQSASFGEISEFVGENTVRHSILASVINHPSALEHDLESFFHLLVLDKKTKLPFGNRYASPETLGYDRIAAAAGGWQLFPASPVLTVVAGTCITYNIIGGDGNFRGGAIAPGLHMRLKAMHEFTDKLPLVPLEGEHPLTGNTTETSLRAGVYHAAIAETEGMISRYETEFPGLKTVIGGGDAGFLAEGLKNGIFARPEIVLEGLNCILNYHVANQLL